MNYISCISAVFLLSFAFSSKIYVDVLRPRHIHFRTNRSGLFCFAYFFIFKITSELTKDSKIKEIKRTKTKENFPLKKYFLALVYLG